MIEAGIIAAAILIVGIAGIVVYRNEQAANRGRAMRSAAASQDIHREGVEAIREELIHLSNDLSATAAGSLNMGNALERLCSGLAESLTARMSTIDADMADLRTRVETGPGKRTLRV